MSKKFQSKAVLASVLALSLALPTGTLAADEATGAETSTQAADEKSEDKKAEAAQKAAEDAEKKFYVVVTVDRSMLGMQPGDMTLVTAEVKAPSDKKVNAIWSSSDPSVASVGQDGRIKANKLGEAVISASVGKIKADVRVTVGLSRLSYDVNGSKATKSGYTNMIEVNSYAKAAEVLPLDVFDGTWNDVNGYFANDDVVKGLTVTETKDGKKVVTKLTENLTGQYKADFKAIEIKDGKVAFVGLSAANDNAADGENVPAPPETTEAYEYKAVEALKADKTLTANVYEAASEDAPYKYLVFSPIQEKEGDKKTDAVYLSYGDDLSSLKGGAEWSAMLVASGTKDIQIVNMFKGELVKPAKAAVAVAEGEAAATESGAEEVAESGAEEVSEDE